MAKPGAFDKDLGYLMPFLERVTAAAETLEDPAAREELRRLMADEKARWARIQELLGGAAGQRGAPAGNGARTEARAPTGSAPRPVGLTVGSLRDGR